jgi:hypothetical protein
MTQIKDKLTASVRTVKASQQVARPDSPAAAKPAPARAPAKPAAPSAPQTSTRSLFPDRVWPD